MRKAVAPSQGGGAAGVGLWLFLRAFASGCTAMTGVEAVSNGVPLFREPTVALARRTLTLIVAILVLLLAGIALLVLERIVLQVEELVVRTATDLGRKVVVNHLPLPSRQTVK